MSVFSIQGVLAPVLSRSSSSSMLGGFITHNAIELLLSFMAFKTISTGKTDIVRKTRAWKPQTAFDGCVHALLHNVRPY